jgi:hypothetical protein
MSIGLRNARFIQLKDCLELRLNCLKVHLILKKFVLKNSHLLKKLKVFLGFQKALKYPKPPFDESLRIKFLPKKNFLT